MSSEGKPSFLETFAAKKLSWKSEVGDFVWVRFCGLGPFPRLRRVITKEAIYSECHPDTVNTYLFTVKGHDGKETRHYRRPRAWTYKHKVSSYPG